MNSPHHRSPALPPIGADHPLVFVAGPCVIDDADLTLAVAAQLAALHLPLIFKASFDKANRSSGTAYRGPGLTAGLNVLAQVKDRFGLPILTDVHLPEQCGPAAEVADVLQIPAFLCRQTDLIWAAAATGRVVNVKRGQFLDPRRMGYVLEKTQQNGPVECWLTERGTAFGHGDLVFDPRAVVWMKGTGAPVLYDCTHSVQQPGGGGPTTGGARELAQPLAQAAAAVGVDGFYAEVHADPSRARSDADTQLTVAQFGALVRAVTAIDAARRQSA
jgi:2-dehydro-3-deoxyphosphooctonate aldolase (KDO 8-P synthase)